MAKRLALKTTVKLKTALTIEIRAQYNTHPNFRSTLSLLGPNKSWIHVVDQFCGRALRVSVLPNHCGHKDKADKLLAEPFVPAKSRNVLPAKFSPFCESSFTHWRREVVY